ncbi:glutamine-rich protein 2 [Equus quagga]|uniref:glutamine-rich protein 2 n=1 Tax=Equus quagga TaxID=89248 RepID=UPI001EE2A2F9|nr:glutamine-rich protein 2 [Equus quagga]
MPPATAATKVTLRELADLAIGTPELGAVNFTALHTLIVAMLKCLNLRETRIDFQAPSPEQGLSLELPQASLSAPQLATPKERRRSSGAGRAPPVLEGQVKELGAQVQDLSRQLKTMGSQVQGIASHVQHLSATASGLNANTRRWLEEKETAMLMPEKPRMEAMKIRKDSEAVSGPRTMELLHDVTEDVKTLKEVHQKAQELPELNPQKLVQRVDELERLIRGREEFLDQIGRKLSVMPVGEEVTMVTWEELEQAITDGWRASQQGSDSTIGLPKRKGQASLTSSDAPSTGGSTKHPTAAQPLESASGFGPSQPLSGTSGTTYPSEGMSSRERSRRPSPAVFPGGEQHPRARDEAGLAKPYHPAVSQFRVESDRRRAREQHSLAHPRRDEQDAHPAPFQQDLPPATSARDWHPQVYPDQHGGVYISQGQIYPRLDQYDLGPLETPDMDQLALLHPSTYHPHGIVPHSTGQLGVMPPMVPGRDQQRLELPRTDQPSMVPLSTYQHGMILPGTDQRGVEQPGMDENVMGPLGMDQHGLVPLGMDQHGFVIFSMDQQGLGLPSMDQHGLVPPLRDERGLVSPGLMQVAADQQGFVHPSLETSGFIQPGASQPALVQAGAGQPGVVQPGAGQPALVQPGAGQPGVVQPGAGQRTVVQPGVGQPGMVQPGAGQPGVVQPGAGQPGVVQPGAGQPGVVQPGTRQPGVVQPGVGQHGVVQPRAGQPALVQPGTGQPGVVQPGSGQPGLVQPGMDQRGLVQPGMDQWGLVQPGMDQHGLVQPEKGQPDLLQPGAGQHGLVQTGMEQRGLVQPGAGQPGTDQGGLVQPATDQPGLVQPGAGQPGLAQPGAGQPGLAQPGAGQAGLAQPGAGQAGLAQPGAGQPGLAQPGAGQPGLAQRGAGQAGLAQPGAGQPGLAQPGAGQAGLAQPGAGQAGLAQPGSGQPGLAQPGAGQPGLAQPGAGQPGLAQPGAGQPGLAQPGAGQPGLVQPSARHLGFVQPGVDQRGLVQPGTDPRGFLKPSIYTPGLVSPDIYPPGPVQPGAYLPGLVQPGAYPRGLVPSGVYPHGLVQPGAYPHSLVQAGAYPHGFVQPGLDQRGLRQPGTDQQGLIPLGTELRRFPTFRADSRNFISPRPYQHSVVPPGRTQHGQVSPLPANQDLALPGIDQEGLVPPETYQHGVMHPGTDQPSPAPLSTGVRSARPDQQHLVSPGPDQRDHAYSTPVSQGVDRYVQVDADPNQTYASNQLGVSTQTTPTQDATFFRRETSLNYLDQVSSEKIDVQSERRESLDKLAPSFPMAVETFRLMGELIGLYVELKENMKDLDEQEAGQTDLEKIQYLLALMVKKTIPPDLQEQLKTLKTLTKEIRQEKAKLDKMQKVLEGDAEQEIGKDMKTGQLTMQLGILRVTVADIEKELAELRESQEQGKVSMENSVSEASFYLQNQLDKLRTIIESMLTSSSTLLSMSMAPHKTLTTLAPGQIDPEATCPACSLDLSHQVSTLVRRYEQLQDMVNNLTTTRPSKKTKLQSQDEELLGHVQRAILQVQGDCEKLNITTSNLIEDHRQKQKDIDVLYQGLEKLEKEKANRENLEMEIDTKADKSALAAKVSRVQFDATTEQLNHMMQELVAKMSGQEQDWQKMLDKLLLEMDTKLDRLELDPVKQLLEDRWKSLRQQLKERSPLYQADEAAAMRRQLLAHFHCLSCDRPLETPVTGQIIPVTPVGPGLPGHRSIRPYTVFELEQVRQQSRNLKLGSAPFPRSDLAQMERSVGRLRTMHSKMLMDIEKVQIHFGGSVKASSQMIRELLQAQCLRSSCYKRVHDPADYTYSTVPRRCGGSHTRTYPYRRNRLQHLAQGLYPTDEIQIAMKHKEVDILGLDGHIYKGRMDTRLPSILSKDTSGVTKQKAKQPRPHVHRQQSLGDNGQLPSRPQSAQMLAGNNSAPSRQWKDRPVSSEGRLSQPNMAHPPSPSEMANVPAGMEIPMDVPPGEGLEEPTRGPRSTSAHRAEQ